MLPLSLRPREAAKALGISLSTLERLTRSGDIPLVKLSRVVLYTVATLKAWLDAKQAKHDESHLRPACSSTLKSRCFLT